MRITIGKKMGLGFGVLLCLVATLAIAVLFHLDSMHRQFSYVIQHDAPVIANARQLLRLVIDMETGQRGFVITGKQEFLEPYENARTEFEELIADEKELVSDNPSQVRRLEKIAISLHEWQTKAAHPEIAMRRKILDAKVDARQLQDALGRGVGKELMDKIMTLGHEIEVAFSGQEDWEGAFAVEVIEKCMADREDGQRGFLITGKEEFLDKYVEGEQKKLPEWFGRLRNIISERGRGDELSEKVDRLEQLTHEWTEKAAEPEVAARREMNKHPESLQDVADMLEIGTGKRIHDSIRADFQRFIDEEDMLTAKRFAAATQAASTTSGTIVVLALVSLIFGAVMAMMITRSITKPVQSLATALGKVAMGDLEQEIQSTSNDEIGVLSRSFNHMTKTLQETSANLKEEAELKDAQATLAELMRDADDLKQLGDRVVELIANSTQSQMGAFYVRPLGDGEGGELHLNGNYAFQPEHSVCEIVTGEELVSQAARSKKSILISDVPADYVKVNSGLGEATPRHLLVVPLLDGARLKGVIELGSPGAFSDDQIAEIETLLRPVAAAIAAKQDAEKIRRLLTATQQQAMELETANEELEVKSTVLERQKADIELRNAELEIAGKEIEEQAWELMQASQYKSEFLANMSHEIRTPMTAILGFAEIVSENVSDPRNVEGLKTIRKNGEHLLEIINDILDLSKIESGKLEVERIECSPYQILGDVASLMRVRASAKGLALEIEYDGPMPRSIQSDPTRLRQILINIVGNAIKFTEVGKIRLLARLLDTDSDEPKIRFDVVDQGIGMTPEQTGRLFQSFVQADTSTTRKYGGTGLGLAISRRLAEMLGGDIHVHSRQGEGSTFSITVPTGPLDGVQMVVDPTEAEASMEPTEKQAGSDVRIDGRVLLAEDGPDNRRLISFILRKAGADLTVAENGQVALDLALTARDEGSPFDVILMDMQMPVLDGYGATRKLREAGYSGQIIALTANAMAEDRRKCLNAGCDDFATKPIDRSKLLAMINTCISRGETTTAS